MPEGGLENAGWKVEFNDKPVQSARTPRRHELRLFPRLATRGHDGTVSDSIVGSPAFDAGISSGMKVVGVNGRVYTPDILQDAIKAAKDPNTPITLTLSMTIYYRTSTIEYHGGERYPHLTREDGKADYLSELSKAGAGSRSNSAALKSDAPVLKLLEDLPELPCAGFAGEPFGGADGA